MTIKQASSQLTFSNRRADLICISFVTRWADASRTMVSDLTQCVDPALVVINAGIFALLADACKSARTILVNSALGPALHEWVALKARRAGALADFACWSCNCILSAWIWVAGINGCGIWRRWANTLNECVALIAWQARADGRMISHVALGVSTTHSGARIIALEISTCLVQRTIAVDHTLWLALDIRITIIERWAIAGTLCIGP